MTEGTERYPGLELIEAAERLGSTLHVEASWDAFAASVEVSASRLRAALELLDELVERPTFPAEEVARLRDERLNDLLQMRAEPRRRVEQAFSEAIYTPDSPYARLAGGDESTVARLTRDELTAIHRTLMAPDQAALVVGGDLTGLDVPRMVEEVLGSLACPASGSSGSGSATAVQAPFPSRPSIGRSFGSITDRARSSPRSESGTSACRVACRTSTPCRSWRRSWAASSTPACS